MPPFQVLRKPVCRKRPPEEALAQVSMVSKTSNSKADAAFLSVFTRLSEGSFDAESTRCTSDQAFPGPSERARPHLGFCHEQLNPQPRWLKRLECQLCCLERHSVHRWPHVACGFGTSRASGSIGLLGFGSKKCCAPDGVFY